MNHPITTTDAVATWKLAHRFVLDAYRLTERLPQSEQAGLTNKVRSAAVRVASNIVEGYARKDAAAYLTHLSDSQIALEEVKYALLVARDLGYISEGQYDVAMAQTEDISERLEAMVTKLSVTQAATTSPAPLTEPDEESPALFGQSRGVRETAKGLWNWVAESTGRLRRSRDEGHVWTETSSLPEVPSVSQSPTAPQDNEVAPSLPSYLEEAKTWNLEDYQTSEDVSERERFAKLG